MEQAKKNILILGAGFGGLAAARALGEYFIAEDRLRRSYEVILIDQHPYQLYTPTLYEIATTSKALAKNIELERIVTFPIEKAIGGLPVTFRQARAKSLDIRKSKIIFEDDSSLNFDYLIIACGAETNFFGVPGLEENSYPLKTFIDAVRIRDAIEAAFSEPETKPIKILVGGGGSTGVELSAELAVWIKHLEKKYKKRGVCRIILLEAGPEILTVVEPRIMEIARTRLEDMGIFIRTDAPVAHIEEREAVLATGERIPFDIFVWAGGVKANRLLADSETKRDSRGRIETANTMECLATDSHLDIGDKIYVIGDAACIEDPKTGKKFVPGVARAAIEQGIIAAYNIIADINKFPKKEYKIKTYPYVIPVGGKWAIAKIGRFTIKGLPGWIVKGLVELRYLDSVLPLPFALKTWLKGLFIFLKND